MRQPHELRAVTSEGAADGSVRPLPLAQDRAKRIVQSKIKRGLDVFLASSALIVLSPLMLGVALAIRLDSPGRVIYRQQRYGLRGETFRIYKFRTMTAAASASSFRQARAGDPRITRIGRFLRRTNIDELPQLLNVLLGHMSLVGPRPHPLALDDAFAVSIPALMRRYDVRPGITGWAQVNGLRGETATVADMAIRVEHDLDYIRRWSPAFDIAIIVRTALGRTAYKNAV